MGSDSDTTMAIMDSLYRTLCSCKMWPCYASNIDIHVPLIRDQGHAGAYFARLSNCQESQNQSHKMATKPGMIGRSRPVFRIDVAALARYLYVVVEVFPARL